MKGFIQIIDNFRDEKISLHISLSSTKQPFKRGMKYCARCVVILSKVTNWKLVVPWRKINWHVLQIAKAQFQVLDLVCNFWKSITYDSARYTFLHLGGARMYQKVLANKTYKKLVYHDFLFFPPLKITFMCTCNFCKYKHKIKEYRNILERKLCSWFG